MVNLSGSSLACCFGLKLAQRSLPVQQDLELEELVHLATPLGSARAQVMVEEVQGMWAVMNLITTKPFD